MAAYTYLGEGDSMIDTPAIGNGFTTSLVMDALVAAVGGGAIYKKQAVGGSVLDVIPTAGNQKLYARVSQVDFASDTFTKYVQWCGTNNSDYGANYPEVFPTIADFTANFQAALQHVYDYVSPRVTEQILIGILASRYYASNNAQGRKNITVKKIVSGLIQEFCATNGLKFYETYARYADLTNTDFNCDLLLTSASRDQLHLTDANYTAVGAALATARVSDRIVNTGYNLDYAWATMALSGTAAIASNNLSLPAIGDETASYVMYYGKQNGMTKYTVTPIGDASKVDIYMRARSENIFRGGHTSLRWIKTNILYSKDAFFVQYKVVAKATSAVITSVKLEYTPL